MRYVAYRSDGQVALVLGSLAFAWRWLCVLEGTGIDVLAQVDQYGHVVRSWRDG